jgi:tRNA A22 N-methylase
LTIRDLVLRYESDVLTRLETLEEDKAEIGGTLHNERDEEFYRDWDDQIEHWKATLADIQSVIEREGFR